jgi:hypothetical protein
MLVWQVLNDIAMPVASSPVESSCFLDGDQITRGMGTGHLAPAHGIEPKRADAIMSDIVDSISSQTGISADLVRKGLGAVLKMLQDQLPPEHFSKLQAVLPDANALMSASESSGSQGGGMLQAVTGLAGKLFGQKGEAATDLFARLGQQGFSADQLQAFLPKVLEHFKDKLPAEVLEKVQGLAPGLPEVAGSSNE